MGNHGGARKGAGRKKNKDSYFQKKINEACNELVSTLLSDDIVRKQIVLQEAKLKNQICLFENKKESVYIIKCNNDYKIGYSSNFKKRIKHYKTHTPEMTVVFYSEVINAFDIESILHNKYRLKNTKGEWFNFTNEEIIDVIGFTNILINGW